MIRYGYIESVDVSLCRARVRFPDDGIVSHALPILVGDVSAGGIKEFRAPAVGAHVVCLMDENLETGVVLGAIYDASNTASGSSGLTRIEFSGGARVEHQAGVITVTSGGKTVEVSAAGIKIRTDSDSLSALLSDLVQANIAETHTSAAPGSPTSPPLNLAAYSALLPRITALLGS